MFCCTVVLFSCRKTVTEVFHRQQVPVDARYSKAAPTAKSLASTCTSCSASGSNNYNTGAVVSNFFIALNASAQAISHINSTPFHIKSVNLALPLRQSFYKSAYNSCITQEMLIALAGKWVWAKWKLPPPCLVLCKRHQP